MTGEVIDQTEGREMVVVTDEVVVIDEVEVVVIDLEAIGIEEVTGKVVELIGKWWLTSLVINQCFIDTKAAAQYKNKEDLATAVIKEKVIKKMAVTEEETTETVAEEVVVIGETEAVAKDEIKIAYPKILKKLWSN